MPFAYSKKNIRSEYDWGILGGLIGAKKQYGKKSIKLLWLPILNKQYTLEKKSSDEILKQAEKHLANGLKYLDSKNPERAMIELRLATPAFNDNPELYEKLGDAFAQAHSHYRSGDLAEHILDELEQHTSEYPQTLKFSYSRSNRSIFIEEALKAYNKVIQLGSDAPLLQRKIIRLTSKKSEKQKLYIKALKKYPNDFSLNIDAILFTHALQKIEQKQAYINQIGYSQIKINTNNTNLIKAYENLAKKYPNSAYLQHIIGSSIRYKTYDKGEHFNIDKAKKAIAHFLKGNEIKIDKPNYQSAGTNTSRYNYNYNFSFLDNYNYKEKNQNFTKFCTKSAALTIGALINELMLREQWQNAGLWFDQMLELNQTVPEGIRIKEGYYRNYRSEPTGWRSNQTLNTAAKIFSQIDKNNKAAKPVMPSLVQYLDKRINAFANQAQKQRWLADLRLLERHLGYITQWNIEKIEAWDNAKTQPAKIPEITTPTTPLQHFDRYVNLDKFFTRNNKKPDGLIATLSKTISSPKDQSATLYFGYDEHASLILNGQEIFAPQKNKIATIDEFKIPIKLKKGTNKLQIKIADKKLAWGFFTLITDQNSKPIK